VKEQRLATIDGWRGVSILLVLGSHCIVSTGFPHRFDRLFIWLFDGALGVRFFFVISGFLITWLLLIEHRNAESVNLTHFYARRALRILPVYFVFLGTLFVLQFTTPFKMSAHTWLGVLTFTSNFLGSSTWTSGHLWSLAVEEQFYLVWPILFVATAGRARTRTAVILLPILVCPILRVLGYLRMMPGSTVGGAFSYDSIAMGCASALVLFNHRQWVTKTLESNQRTVVALGLSLILIPYVLAKLFIVGFFTVPFGMTTQALGFCAILLAGVINPKCLFFPALEWRWLVQIGILSYSIYIWQMIFCTQPEAFGLGHVFWLSFPWWMIAAIVTAFFSFHLLERPLFSLRKHLRP
jgi:peptidoglycan/LPS O-acetylase OafA/YrhL